MQHVEPQENHGKKHPVISSQELSNIPSEVP